MLQTSTIIDSRSRRNIDFSKILEKIANNTIGLERERERERERENENNWTGTKIIEPKVMRSRESERAPPGSD